MFGILGYIRLFGLLAAGLVAFIGWSSVQSVITNYTEMSGTITALKKEKSLLDARMLSYERRISRRDDAIAASKCAVQIKDWVSHPEKLPEKFDPFNQLSAPRQ